MYSAIKQGGQKLYELARAGLTVERTARAVTIDALDIVEWSPLEFVLDVTCSSGTYIRSVAHDIGQILGVGAHLSALVRTASGRFRLEDAVELDALFSDWRNYIILPSVAFADRYTVYLTAQQADEIAYGRAIPKPEWTDELLAMAYTADGNLLAVLESRGDFWKPHKVFLPQD
jgi:tRNA pseudouridine55 synthase